MKKTIAIIGGGPSALILAAELNVKKFDVTIYERNYAIGRKFLVAGNGGFNLTHAEDSSQLIKRYVPSSFFAPLINTFDNISLQKWLENVGIKTFKGSSNRIFPIKGTKPIDVLNAFLTVIKSKNICIKTNHEWRGWDSNDQLLLNHLGKETLIKPDLTVFALGGASWKVTGSDGKWLSYFNGKDVLTIPFQPSNCGYKVKWSQEFVDLAEGKSLKNISVKCNTLEKKGELVITQLGLEGGAIYALSSEIRKELNQEGIATIHIDLKPSLPLESIIKKLRNKAGRSSRKLLEDELNFNSIHLSLLKFSISKEEYTDPFKLAEKIKQLPLTIIGTDSIDNAISTVGGIDLSEIDNHFELKKLANNFVIGEMLDWDAPTGGYLLQACFSMGFKLANFLNQSI